MLFSELGISLFEEGESDSLSLGKRNGGGLSITNNLDVGNSGGEGVSLGVLDMNNIVRTGMLLDRHENSNSSNVVSSGDHNSGSLVELDDSRNLLGLEVVLKNAFDYFENDLP